MAPRAKGIIVPISATDNTARAFDSVNAQVEQLRAKVRELSSTGGGAGNALAAGMSHATPQIAAASGAIRELSGALPIRAVERFLTQSLGLGPVLAKAFPVIGAIAVGEAIFEAGEKFTEMLRKANGAGEEIRKQFAAVNSELRITNQEATVAADKLEDDIAKLEKRPGNGLQTGLDEATLASERLAASLDKNIDKVKELLEKNKVAFFSGLASGKGGTEDTSNLVLDRKRQIDAVRAEYDKVVEQARASGDQNNISQAIQQRLVALQKAYQDGDAALANAQAAVKATQAQRNSPGNAFGVGLTQKASGVTYSSSRDNSDNANILSGARELLLQEQNQIGTDFRKSVDERKKSILEMAKATEDGEKKAEQLRRQQAEADEKAAAAQRSMADANTKALAAQQKAGTDTELDVLESKHRAQLVSDDEFYRQREAIQARAIQNQRDAIAAQRGALTSQVDSVTKSGVGLTGIDAENNNSRIVELRAKIVDLDARDAALTGEGAKNTRDRADAETELAKRRLATADSLAAQLEAERGGSVTARQRQSRDQYSDRRAGLAGADPSLLADLDSQQGIDQDSIAAKGADQDFGAGDAQRRVARTGIDDQLRRGQISQQDAQRQKIALDRQEADAMQPLLAAYQKLAADGDLAAIDKVAELQQKISELKNPVNELGATIRSQLDSAFEGFFDNIRRGHDRLKALGDAIQKDATKDLYTQFIRPALQNAGSILVPNRNTAGRLPGSGSPAAAAPSTLSKVLGGAAGGKASAPQVNIVIQNMGQPISSTQSAPQSMSGIDSYIVNVVLDNLSKGGELAQALSV